MNVPLINSVWSKILMQVMFITSFFSKHLYSQPFHLLIQTKIQYSKTEYTSTVDTTINTLPTFWSVMQLSGEEYFDRPDFLFLEPEFSERGYKCTKDSANNTVCTETCNGGYCWPFHPIIQFSFNPSGNIIENYQSSYSEGGGHDYKYFYNTAQQLIRMEEYRNSTTYTTFIEYNSKDLPCLIRFEAKSWMILRMRITYL